MAKEERLLPLQMGVIIFHLKYKANFIRVIIATHFYLIITFEKHAEGPFQNPIIRPTLLV